MKTAQQRWGPVIAPVVVGVVLLALWQLLVTVGGVSDYLLPSPSSIGGEIRSLWPALVKGFGITGFNALLGLVAGSLLAIVLAACAAAWRPIDGMAAPVVAALAVIPIVALAPVLGTMLGADSEMPRRIIAALAAFTPVFLNTLRGLRQALPVHRDLMHAYAASGWQTLRTVTLPTAVPFVFTGVRTASSLAVISALVAEYFGGPRGGLGGLISTYAAQSAYARSWAFVVASIVLGLVFSLVTALVARLVSRG
ncbi:MAG: ABC transporter permease subunit [Microbacterium sp.]